jgi:hypothetical protein
MLTVLEINMRLLKFLFFLSLLFLAGAAHADEPAGSRYFQLGAPGSTGPTSATIFQGSDNIAGATIRTLSAATSTATQMFVEEIYPDGTSRVLFNLVSAGNGVANATLPYPLDLAPGVGLFVILVGGVSGQLYVTYDFR